jgi:hypothetical protein
MRKPVPRLLSLHDAFMFGKKGMRKGEVWAFRASPSPFPIPSNLKLRRHFDRRLRSMRSGGIFRHCRYHLQDTSEASLFSLTELTGGMSKINDIMKNK